MPNTLAGSKRFPLGALVFAVLLSLTAVSITLFFVSLFSYNETVVIAQRTSLPPIDVERVHYQVARAIYDSLESESATQSAMTIYNIAESTNIPQDKVANIILASNNFYKETSSNRQNDFFLTPKFTLFLFFLFLGLTVEVLYAYKLSSTETDLPRRLGRRRKRK